LPSIDYIHEYNEYINVGPNNIFKYIQNIFEYIQMMIRYNHWIYSYGKMSIFNIIWIYSIIFIWWYDITIEYIHFLCSLYNPIILGIYSYVQMSISVIFRNLSSFYFSVTMSDCCIYIGNNIVATKICHCPTDTIHLNVYWNHFRKLIHNKKTGNKRNDQYFQVKQVL
jgi:hypothetical protein